MKPFWSASGVELYLGHVLDVLGQLPEGYFQCVVTSPPYWSLRDYKLPPVDWPSAWFSPMAGVPELEVPGCDPECEHDWRSHIKHRTAGGPQVPHTKWPRNTSVMDAQRDQTSHFCAKCGGWRGCLGMEPTPEMYVAHLVLVFRAVWRVLRPDGVVWLNLGDTYMGSGQGWQKSDSDSSWRRRHLDDLGRRRVPSAVYNRRDLKPKDMVCIPWRVALALQAEGWWLRRDVVWAKGLSFCPTYSGSSMPESVTDRPATSHEYLFLLSKRRRYFYDNEAVKEQGVRVQGPRPFGGTGARRRNEMVRHYDYKGDTGKRNLRSVWTIGTRPFQGPHFAVFPPGLVEPCIKAGTSEWGACVECGAPWERVIARTDIVLGPIAAAETIGWRPTCSCYGELGSVVVVCSRCRGERVQAVELPNPDPYLNKGYKPHSGDIRNRALAVTGKPCPRCGGTGRVVAPVGKVGWSTVPCVVLDPFCGTGAAGETAIKLGRAFVGIDLSPDYCAMAKERLSKPVQLAMPEAVDVREERPPEPVQLRML